MELFYRISLQQNAYMYCYVLFFYYNNHEKLYQKTIVYIYIYIIFQRSLAKFTYLRSCFFERISKVVFGRAKETFLREVIQI